MMRQVAIVAAMLLAGCAGTTILQKAPAELAWSTLKPSTEVQACLKPKLAFLGNLSEAKIGEDTVLSFGLLSPEATVAIRESSYYRIVELRTPLGYTEAMRSRIQSCL